MNVEALTESVPGKPMMLVALAVMDRRQRVDGQLCRKLVEGAAQQQIVDQRVGGERQVVAVLLDGGGGQNEQRRSRGSASTCFQFR